MFFLQGPAGDNGRAGRPGTEVCVKNEYLPP